jgi:phosphatidylinositol phospholipase C delta
MYLRNGGAGYVIKPLALLDPSYPFDHKQHRRTKHLLHIKVISAQQLPRPKDTQGHEIIDKNTVDPYVKVAIHIPIWASGQTSETIAPISVAPIVTQQSTDKHTPAPGKVTSKSSTQEAVLAEAGPAGEEEVGAAVGEREVKVKTKTIPNNGFNPLWNEKLTLPFDVFGEGMNDLIFVRFLVKDSNMEKDGFVGGYCTSLGSLEMGE